MTKESKIEAPASPTGDDPGIPSKSFQWTIPAAVAVLGTLSFTASAAREWAYYLVIGAEDFISMTSPSDYTSATLRWLPALVLVSVVWVVLEMLTSRVEGFQTEKQLIQNSPNPRLTNFLRVGGRYLGIAGVIGGGFWYVAQAHNPLAKAWVFPVAGCWTVFSVWFFSHPRVYHGLAKTGRRLLIFGPFLAALVITDGYDEAQGDLELPHGEYRIVHSNGKVEDDVQLLRTTSNGILILRVSTRDVSFLTYPSFNRIDRIGSSQ